MIAESNSIVRAGELLTKLRAEIGNALVGQKRDRRSDHHCADSLRARAHRRRPRSRQNVAGPRPSAQAMSLNVGRIQFTPDLMPSDISRVTRYWIR